MMETKRRPRNFEVASTVLEEEKRRLRTARTTTSNNTTQRRTPRRPIEVSSPSTTTHPTDKRSFVYDPAPLFTTTGVFLSGSVLILLAHLWPPLALVVLWMGARLQRYWFRVNDEPTTRRKMIKEFLKTDPVTRPLRTVPTDTVHVEESYWINLRGMSLMTSIMTPTNRSIEAVVCFCHGYTDSPTLTKQKALSLMTRAGIAVIMIEYEGHGRSDGILGLVTDWDKLIDDTTMFFQQTVKKRFQNKPCFLMGESMGGAVAYCTYKRDPKLFHGVVFCCPMCKIGDDCLPPQWVIDIFRKLAGPKGTASTLGYLPIAPSQGVDMDWSIRPHKQAMLSAFPLEYGRKPRLATARELLDVTIHISNDLPNFDAPFLVQHGCLDRVTDPRLSEALYKESKSNDKTIRLYDGMLHSLLVGEFDENVSMVLQDSIQWILDRSVETKQL